MRHCAAFTALDCCGGHFHDHGLHHRLSCPARDWSVIVMKKLVSAFLIGAIFGLGITLSGMINPSKVLNFFDISGNWDPSLVFVMAGGLATAFIGYRLVFARTKAPVFEPDLALPAKRRIDAEL